MWCVKKNRSVEENKNNVQDPTAGTRSPWLNFCRMYKWLLMSYSSLHVTLSYCPWGFLPHLTITIFLTCIIRKMWKLWFSGSRTVACCTVRRRQIWVLTQPELSCRVHMFSPCLHVSLSASVSPTIQRHAAQVSCMCDCMFWSGLASVQGFYLPLAWNAGMGSGSFMTLQMCGNGWVYGRLCVLGAHGRIPTLTPIKTFYS